METVEEHTEENPELSQPLETEQLVHARRRGVGKVGIKIE